MNTAGTLSARRLRALIVKEFYQIRRDPSSILIAFILPLLLLFIFGYGISLDSGRLRVGLVAGCDSPEAHALAAALRGSAYFEVKVGRDLRELAEDLTAGRLRGIVVIPPDFGERLRAAGAGARVQVVTDGSEPLLAAFVDNYARGAFRVWAEQLRGQRAGPPAGGITVEAQFRYNPSTRSRNFLLPGAIAVIMTVIGALLTALVVAREWERGTMEALLASPVSRLELILGKIIPYFLLGIGSFTVCLVCAVYLFGVPLRGSIPAVYLATSVFLLTALGIGLSISAVARDQFVAAQAALNAAFLPALILSGFVFEIRSMPLWIQAVSCIIPARYFVGCLQTLFLAGDVWGVLLPNIGFLTITSALFIGLTARNIRRRLD